MEECEPDVFSYKERTNELYRFIDAHMDRIDQNKILLANMMVDLVKDGVLDPMDVIKYETQGSIPKTALRLRIANPESDSTILKLKLIKED